MNYFYKTFDRIKSVQEMIPFAKNEVIKINGKLYKNPFFMENDIKRRIEEIMPDTFTLIHGDTTFSNIMFDVQKNKAVLIDPRGYFGNTKYYGDPNYDWAKLYYSLFGNYDQFNRKNFVLEIYPENVQLAVQSNNWADMEEEFFIEIGEEKIKAIKFIHAIIWLSLTTYAWDDYDSICGAFYNGVVLLNDALNKQVLELSSLNHTWLLDVDGTIVEHNGYKEKGEDIWLAGAKQFMENIDSEDKIIILTSRLEEYKNKFENFLKSHNIRWDKIIYGLPHGERILINDQKPSGMKTAYAINRERDSDIDICIKINEKI